MENVVAQCDHLNAEQKTESLSALQQHPTLFNGQLGRHADERMHLDVDPTAPPKASGAHPIPQKHMELFKAELERLVKIGVFEPCGRSEWIAGAFTIPKKDSRMRWIADFRALNEAVERKIFPVLVTSEVPSRRSGHEFLTKMDSSMCHCALELDDESKELTTFATP